MGREPDAGDERGGEGFGKLVAVATQGLRHTLILNCRSKLGDTTGMNLKQKGRLIHRTANLNLEPSSIHHLKCLIFYHDPGVCSQNRGKPTQP